MSRLETAVPRGDGLTDWYYLMPDDNQVRQVVKVGYQIKLERVFRFDSFEDALEFFQARQQEKQRIIGGWGYGLG